MTDTLTKGLIFKEDLSQYDGVSTTGTRQTSTGGTQTLKKVDYPGVDVHAVYGAQTGAAISSAQEAIGTTNKRSLYLSQGTWTLSANLTINSNIYLKIPPGATIDPNGYTLTIDSPDNIIAGAYKIFESAVTFTNKNGTEYGDWTSGSGYTYVAGDTHTWASVSAKNTATVAMGADFDDDSDTTQNLFFISGYLNDTFDPGASTRQLNVLHVRVADNHDNAMGTMEGVVAGMFHAYIDNSVAASRVWGLNPYAQIVDGSDGQLNGVEVNVENAGSSQSDPTQSDTKRGIIIAIKDATSGTTYPATVGVQIQHSPTDSKGVHNAFYVSASGIEDGGTLLWHNGVTKIGADGRSAFGTDTIPASTHMTVYTDDATNILRMDRDAGTTGNSHQITFAADDDGGTTTTYGSITCNVTDNTAGSEIGDLGIWTQNGAGSLAKVGYFKAGFVVGTPTGGDNGAGTISAVGVYDDDVLLTCYPFEYWRTGKIDLHYWDSITPDRRDEDGNLVENRIHTEAHDFSKVAEDRLNTEKYVEYLVEHGHLPAMPERASSAPTAAYPAGN